MKRLILSLAAITCLVGNGRPAQASIILAQPPTPGGGNSWPAAPSSQRWQQVYSNSFFGSTPVQINSFSFFDLSSGSTTYGSFTVTLSTTTAAPGSLSTTYAANVGGNAALDFSGPMTLSDVAGLTTVTLSTPFLYDPTQGNLLIDITHGAGTNFSGFLDFSSYNRSPTGLQRIANVPNSPTGVNWGFGELPTQFEVSAQQVPEPATITLLTSGFFAFGGFGLVRRRRGASESSPAC
jgi:hypothetical protein